MTTDDPDDAVNPEEAVDRLVRVGEKHFAAEERDAAWDLIRDAFGALPWELQDLYLTYVETYNSGQREKASELFEKWLDQARELGLI
jgi:hypothetical protein